MAFSTGDNKKTDNPGVSIELPHLCFPKETNFSTPQRVERFLKETILEGSKLIRGAVYSFHEPTGAKWEFEHLDDKVVLTVHPPEQYLPCADTLKKMAQVMSLAAIKFSPDGRIQFKVSSPGIPTPLQDD